jgi:xanthine dehydrogenase accessory factor
MKGVDLFEQAAALRREGRSFALATVVARRAPVSAHLGDRAIVFADGRMEGFVGGACSREIIRQQAIEALHARCSRLVSIRPDAGEPSVSTGEHVVVPMTCVSEGAIDVYVEPFVAARRLIVAGATPVAEWLARLARTLDYDVVRAVEAREMRDVEAQAAALGVTVIAIDALETSLRDAVSSGADLAAVVVSQGHYDEEALEAILKCGVPYVGLVASRTRGTAVRAMLEARGVPGVPTIRNPAGLDLGARTPPEVALSILAEIIQSRPAGVAVLPAWPAAAAVPPSSAVAPASAATAIDPVCGMSVAVASARQKAELDGVAYYFCCANCRSKFLTDPQAYLVRP